jgi:probable F420-dependent oxidoreductase
VASSLESFGYGTLWVPGGAGGDLFGDVDAAIEATEKAVVATGVLNIWMHRPEDTARWFARVEEQYPGRLLVGLGASHAALVESTDQTYHKPLTVLRQYVDALDTASPPLPPGRRILAALGPKMLELAGEQSLGAHTYLVNPAHTRIARDTLGPNAILAPELKVVLESNPMHARRIARTHLEPYLKLPNYVRNLLRLGYSEHDCTGGGSDRLIDDVVAWGGVQQAVQRVRQHMDAGANHVCVQVLTEERREIPYDAWRELAPALLELSRTSTP